MTTPTVTANHLEIERRQASMTASASSPPSTTSSGRTAWNPTKRWFSRSA